MSKNRYSAEPGEDGKPRRLDQGTVQYLKQIDPELDNIRAGYDGGDGDMDTRDILIGNVLEELKTRTASAACDRNVNSIVEKICLAGSFEHVIELLRRFTPYALFLARNRHSSHILQSTLSRLCYLLKSVGIPDDIDEDDVIAIILEFMQPVLSDFNFSAKDMNATHVLRAVLCALAGLPVISERRGKTSKHQHSVGLSEPLDSLLLQPDGFHIDSACSFSVPDSFHELLGTTVIEGLLGLQARDLQTLVVDLSGAAVVSFIVRILFSPGLIEGGPELGDRLVRAVLEWKDDRNNDDGPTVFYAMAGERSGSFFLETMLQCCKTDFFLDITERAVKTRTMEYAEDNSANFVLQTILRRLLSAVRRAVGCDEESGPDMIATAKRVMSLASALLAELLEPLSLSMLLNRRGGALFWVIKIADLLSSNTNTAICDSLDSDMGNRLTAALLKLWGVTPSETAEKESTLSFHVEELSRRLSAKPVEADGKDKADLPPAKKASDTSRDPLQLMTARLVGAMLEMRDPPTLEARQLLSRAVAAVDSKILFSIATSGQMSKALLDTIFTAEGDIYSSAREKAMNSLLGSAIELSCHFVGQHIIRTYYNSTSRPSTREKLVISLIGPDVPSERKELLRRSKEGLGILNLTQADLYVRSRDDWKASMRKYEQGKSLLRDLDIMKESAPSTSAPARDVVAPVSARVAPGASYSAAAVTTAPAVNMSDVVGAPEKRKRKRKRGGNKGKDGADGEDNNDDKEDEGEVVVSEAAPVEVTPVGSKSKNHKTAPAADVEANDDTMEEHPVKRPKSSSREESTHPVDEEKVKKKYKSEKSSGGYDKHSSHKRGKSSNSKTDMELVRTLNSAKLMSRSMLTDTISRLEAEKKSKS